MGKGSILIGENHLDDDDDRERGDSPVTINMDAFVILTTRCETNFDDLNTSVI